MGIEIPEYSIPFLKSKHLPTDDMNNSHVLNSLFEAALPYMPATVASDDDDSAGIAASDLEASQ